MWIEYGRGVCMSEENNKINSFLKRLYDIVFSIVFIIITCPVMLFSILGIKLSSKGRVIYKADRIGKNGKIFKIYKFRTMNVESGAIGITTLKNDNRIFKFGKFLRKTKIDELPQLFNVLIGEMSVVGPRPEDLINAKKIYINGYEQILSVKPGLTSIASLYDYTHGEKYESDELYFNEFVPQKLQLELFYVKNMSIFLDIKLSALTGYIIFLVILGKKEFKKPKEIINTEKKVGVLK